ncbi:MAG: hypothetical protein ABJL67_12525 [Sulfitobacter sp.]
MPKQKQSRTYASDCHSPRTKQSYAMELLTAASEAEVMLAGWLFDQRSNTELFLS